MPLQIVPARIACDHAKPCQYAHLELFADPEHPAGCVLAANLGTHGPMWIIAPDCDQSHIIFDFRRRRGTRNRD